MKSLPQRQANITGQKSKYRVVLAVALFAIGIAAVIMVVNATNNLDSQPAAQSPTDTAASEDRIPPAPEAIDNEAAVNNQQAQEDMLVYLIEEEKLAHDVYTVMYQTYGAKVFGNILESEETHQSRVLTLLQANNIADPRSSEIGVFNDAALQQLYDTLIAQGMRSELDAYKVGVAIEEKDIADITTQLASATDADILSTLESLRSGSENHLRAFNRQVGRY